MSCSTTEMRAAVYHGPGDVRIENRPVPAPEPGELLLRVGTVGVCGSDVGEFLHGPHQIPLTAPHPVTAHVGPMITGHEFSGTVVGTGEGVDEGWLGARVASVGSIACGACAACQEGRSNQCAAYAAVGLHRDGALAGYVRTPTANCLRIDGLGLSLDEAALCQPMAIAVHNVARAGDVAGQLVLVQGVGGIGAFLVYALVAAGAEVIATDMDPQRLDVAGELGAAATVQVDGAAADRERIGEAVRARELRVVFEVSGSRSGLATALAVAPKGARIVLVGIQAAPVEIDLARVTVAEQALIGTNALVRETDFPRALELVARRAGRWERIAPMVLPLDELVSGAIEPMGDGRAPAIKTLVDPFGTRVRALRTERQEAGR